MMLTNRLSQSRQDRRCFGEPAEKATESIQGTLQRVDYQRREIRVIAQGRPWQLVLAPDCRLWFDNTPAILRCFHPLDPVTVLFRSHGTEFVAKVLYSWEPQRNVVELPSGG
jgi:hypothetical protein